MEIGDARAQEIRDIRASLGPIEFATTSPSVGTREYSTEYEQAALLSSFGSEELDLDSRSVREVLKDCAVVVVGEDVRYVLSTDVRRRVLRQLGSRPRMQAVLEMVGHIPHEPLQEAIVRIVEDQEVVDEGAPLPWLQIAYQALSWFAGIVDTTGTPEQVRAQIEEIGQLDRFERLVGDNFRGREHELRELGEYVGVQPYGGGLLRRVLQHWTSFDEKPALVISGPGGIGKSALLAKFILDHARLAGRDKLPYICINFDNPTVRAGDPKTVLMEAVRQLAIQYPAFVKTFTAQRSRWQTALLELSDLTDTAHRVRDRELTGIVRKEFVDLLRSVKVDDRPLLLILDTFEIVQERQRGDVATVYRFLHDLQRDYPALRVVISGRAAPEDASSGLPADEGAVQIRTRVLSLRGLDRETTAAYLVGAGLPVEHAEEVARHLVPDEAIDEGVSPLSARVAAEIWHRDRERPELDTTFWAQLRAGRIQAQLITRYVRHADPDSLAGRLALPGLLLRRIDRDVLASVVAPAWDIPLAKADVESVFGEMGALISIVVEHADGTLVPRHEVQRQVVDLLADAEAKHVAQLHDLAVTYYASISDLPDLNPKQRDAARFEEVVHRLARGDHEDAVRSRWTEGCSDFLTGRIPLLSSGAQTVLEQLAGIELTRSMLVSASRRVAREEVTRQARRALEGGEPAHVITLAAELDDWNRASELSLVLARAQLALGQPVDALDVAAEAIAETDPGSSTWLVSDLHQVAAEASYAIDRPQDVLDYLDDVLAISREREDVGRIVIALLLQLSVQQDRDDAASRAIAPEVASLLAAYGGALPEPDQLRLFALAGRYTVMVPAAIRSGGLRLLTPKTSRQLARLITDVDTEVSAERGEEPGVLARMAGLPVRDSVTRTWQDALGGPPHVAERAMLAALTPEVQSRVMLTKELAAVLARAALQPRKQETAPVDETGVRLNYRRRRELVASLVSEIGLERLEAILAEEFDRSASSLTSLDVDQEYAVEALVRTAEREDWLVGLIIAIRNWFSSAPRMLQIANEMDISAINFAASSLARTAGARDLPAVLARLGTVEGQIGRIEHGKRVVGTGLLVSPQILLAAASSVGDGRLDPKQISVRFGLKADAKGRPFDRGISFDVADDALADVIPYEGGSGFALLRLDGYPADEPLGTGPAQSFHQRRGFADISGSAEMSVGQNALVCWQQEARLELRIERRALSRDGSVFTIPSLGKTSEGAPVFDRSMQFLGLVLESRQESARVVPGGRLWQTLRDHGYGDTVGVALA
jgi:hypothetical protein